MNAVDQNTNQTNRNKTLFTGLFVLLAAAAVGCSLQPRIDTGAVPPGTLQPGQPGYVPPLQPGQPGYVPSQPGAYACDLDTRQVVETQGRLIEIITSRGRLFEFENGVPVQAAGLMPQLTYSSYPGVVGVQGAYDLGQIPLYASGPCVGMAPGACVFDTQAFVLLPEGRFLEYVTVEGRQWVFENNAMTGAGVDLLSIPRYRDLCSMAYQTGGRCIIDTRTFVKNGPALIESITAYGRLWQYDVNGVPTPDSGMDLSAIPRYASGPCRMSPPGQCVFGTRTFDPAAGQLIETVTVDGMAYRYATASIEAQATPVSSTPHWLNGPCR